MSVRESYQAKAQTMPDQNPTFTRTAKDLVAVNPERITTLGELAAEHYGDRCGRCGKKFNKKRYRVVHHRHYRTVGFEKPVDDIVQLCRVCHDDLHIRAKADQLNHTDIPYVDPQWADWLKKRPTFDERNQAWPEGVYNPNAYTPDQLKPFRITFRTAAGQQKTVTERYPNLEIATSNAESQRAFYGHLSVERIEESN